MNIRKYVIFIIIMFSISSLYWCTEFKNTTNKDHIDTKKEKTITLSWKIEQYLQNSYSHGYLCDTISWAKYFFDFIAIPYHTKDQYLIHYGINGYYKTDMGNITNCWGGGGNIIIHDDWEPKIYIVYKYPDSPWMSWGLSIEDIKLLKKYPIKDTTYEQAKEYFHTNEDKSFYKQCPKKFCNKIRYSVIETGNELNDNIDSYTTEILKDLKENGGRRSLIFSWDFTMIENHHWCPNNVRCKNTGTRRYTNEYTIEYPIPWEKVKTQRFEIVNISDTLLKIHRIYQ